MADHQAPHVYVPDSSDVPRVRDLLAALPGVDEVFDRTGQAGPGVDHPNAGELVAVAEPDAWLTYYYWLDDQSASDFARGVEIHRKPGYDPAELFFGPCDPLVKAKEAVTLLRKKASARAPLAVVPLNPTCVRGSHGRLPDDTEDMPVVLCSESAQERERFHASEIKDLVLRLHDGK